MIVARCEYCGVCFSLVRHFCMCVASWSEIDSITTVTLKEEDQ